MKRVFCFLLALLMLSTSFVACGDKKGPVSDSPESTVADSAAATTGVEELPDIPLSGNYDGYEFRTLTTSNHVFNDFDFEEESSMPLDNAQYKRKKKVEEDFNIEIVATNKQVLSNGDGQSLGYQLISKQVNSGTQDYDLCIISGYDASVLAYSGYLYDLQSIEAINLQKSWWDQNAVDSLTIQGVTFYTTGDITVSDNRTASCFLFNKRLLADYALDSPYDMVYDGTWTIENFSKMARSVSEDLNQDGIYDENDRFGLLIWDDSIMAMISAAGQRCCTIEDNAINLTLYNESTISAFEQYADIAYDTQYSFQYQRVPGLSGYTVWSADQALFFTYLVDALPRLREMESDFGVLPYPKLTEAQEEYYSLIAPFNSNFVCMPLMLDDPERTGVITEALAYYGQKVVLPALYDVTLIGQSTRDEESEPMLEIVFGNLVYDIGYYYQVGSYNLLLMDLLRARSTGLASAYDSHSMAANIILKTINRKYQEAVAMW